MCHQVSPQAMSVGHPAEYQENNLTILCGSLLHLPLVQYVNKHNQCEKNHVIDDTQQIPSAASYWIPVLKSRAQCGSLLFPVGRKRDSAGLRHHSEAKHRGPTSPDSQCRSAFSSRSPLANRINMTVKEALQIFKRALHKASEKNSRS